MDAFIVNYLKFHTENVTAQEILEAYSAKTGESPNKRTIQRHLEDLVKARIIQSAGRTKAREYYLDPEEDELFDLQAPVVIAPVETKEKIPNVVKKESVVIDNVVNNAQIEPVVNVIDVVNVAPEVPQNLSLLGAFSRKLFDALSQNPSIKVNTRPSWGEQTSWVSERLNKNFDALNHFMDENWGELGPNRFTFFSMATLLHRFLLEPNKAGLVRVSLLFDPRQRYVAPIGQDNIEAQLNDILDRLGFAKDPKDYLVAMADLIGLSPFEAMNDVVTFSFINLLLKKNHFAPWGLSKESQEGLKRALETFYRTKSRDDLIESLEELYRDAMMDLTVKLPLKNAPTASEAIVEAHEALMIRLIQALVKNHIKAQKESIEAFLSGQVAPDKLELLLPSLLESLSHISVDNAGAYGLSSSVIQAWLASTKKR